jgi:hypothetical protein
MALAAWLISLQGTTTEAPIQVADKIETNCIG